METRIWSGGAGSKNAEGRKGENFTECVEGDVIFLGRDVSSQ